ncbi:hypothetical protein BDQ17DRAFT_669202 [Cyathus striatus]|nr:hypothetical protein BDQ17DRAFT_669202 [Cyathus striatus]
MGYRQFKLSSGGILLRYTIIAHGGSILNFYVNRGQGHDLNIIFKRHPSILLLIPVQLLLVLLDSLTLFVGIVGGVIATVSGMKGNYDQGYDVVLTEPWRSYLVRGLRKNGLFRLICKLETLIRTRARIPWTLWFSGSCWGGMEWRVTGSFCN